MKSKVEKLNVYFEQSIAACKERENALISDQRADEANFEKIRANIYDIFRTILNAALKKCGDDESAVKEFFAEKIESIPSGWKTELENASMHGDAEKQRIEEIKLEAAVKIKTEFVKIWG